MNISTWLNARKLLLSILTMTSLGASAQIVTIPDANFKVYLVGHSLINTNGDTEIQVTEATAFTGTISCFNLSISDLTGIEAFTNLTVLQCDNNSLTSLDVTQNTALTQLHCYNNSLTNLNVTQCTALTELFCHNNSLTSLDVTQNTALTKLACENNSLTSLNVTPCTALTVLFCYNNSLTSLDVTQNTLLVDLVCFINQLTSLDVTQNTALTLLNCYSNSLSSLDVTQNTALTALNCSYNSLTSLDVTQNTALTTLNCSYNSLTSLNVANGNNSNFTLFYASTNPNLTCIQVDNVAYSTTNWTVINYNIDATASFSTNCASVGIKEATQNLALTTYPNPTTGVVSFSTNEQINNIAVFNLTGQQVAMFSNTNTIDISNLPKGMYTAKISVNGKLVVKKIIKE